MKHTTYLIAPSKRGVRFRAAVAADLHGRSGTDAIRILKAMKPDLILIPGDLSDHFHTSPELMSFAAWNGYRKAISFLREAVRIAPVFYSLGNHEMGGVHSGRPWAHKNFPPYRPIDESIKSEITELGVTLLDDGYVMWNGIAIGGLTSALTYPEMKPNLAFLKEFSSLAAYKVLLSHHPEYYPQYLSELDIDLIVSGHAHGGQWSFFGQAVFAPGQGLFPALVRGVHENRLAVSRGMTNTAYLPRIGVPREVLELRVGCPYERL